MRGASWRERPPDYCPSRDNQLIKRFLFLTGTVDEWQDPGYYFRMTQDRPTMARPDLALMRRIEELLREQLAERGEDPDHLPAELIARHMHCGVSKNGALAYVWKGDPILDVNPEPLPGGGVRWRIFIRDTPLQ
ncbi:hypothetical protein LJC15_02045 [Desulfovibrio sp. OttesenSCG-928-G11]|nr:hypothetical protein [Desulfovibrio sp. OttesenSCG-928-G11]